MSACVVQLITDYDEMFMLQDTPCVSCMNYCLLLVWLQEDSKKSFQTFPSVGTLSFGQI